MRRTWLWVANLQDFREKTIEVKCGVGEPKNLFIFFNLVT